MQGSLFILTFSTVVDRQAKCACAVCPPLKDSYRFLTEVLSLPLEPWSVRMHQHIPEPVPRILKV